MNEAISDGEFTRFQSLMQRVAGIHLPPTKKPLVSGRLAKRLRARGLDSYGDYYRLIVGGDPAELQTAIELLTTNETYFFRESQHFDFLAREILPALRPGSGCRVWSAASSSGEEAYSIAMVLMDKLGESASWEVFGSDINGQVLDLARRAVYPTARNEEGIPADYRRRFCLRGTGAMAGKLRVAAKVRERVRFAQLNLNGDLTSAGDFEVIFLRNVMIYFDLDMKRRVVAALRRRLRPGGWLFVGHSESLHGVADGLRALRPTIFRRDTT
ncbi:MAG TPA: protein-glutamate O-methyltransferase CheR [Gammaproteobacteria bacterium]|nr:protein-glutamate O-methyltransferase CheR [Gammaproteobacteria bacterium]